MFPRPAREARPRLTRGRQRVGLLATAAAAAGGVALRVEPARSATQACVVVGVPFRVSPWALEAGGGGAPADGGAYFDESALAFAAFELVREKLAGTVADATRNRVTAVACGAQGGEFLLSVTCAPTFAAARKAAGAVLQALRWGGLYARYADRCRALGGAPDRAAFGRAAEVADRATRSGVAVVMAGKVEAEPAKVAAAAAALAGKVLEAPPRGEGGRRREVRLPLPAPLARRFRARPAPGLLGVAARDFAAAAASAAAGGEAPRLFDGTLFVPARADPPAARAAAGARAEKYAAGLARVGPEARGALVFAAARGCLAPTAELDAGGPPLTAAAVLAAVRAAFR